MKLEAETIQQLQELRNETVTDFKIDIPEAPQSLLDLPNQLAMVGSGFELVTNSQNNYANAQETTNQAVADAKPLIDDAAESTQNFADVWKTILGSLQVRKLVHRSYTWLIRYDTPNRDDIDRGLEYLVYEGNNTNGNLPAAAPADDGNG